MTATPTPIPFESLWTANDVAAFLKVSRSWVYQKSEAGLLPSIKVGGLLRFEAPAIKAWLHSESAPVIPFNRGMR